MLNLNYSQNKSSVRLYTHLGEDILITSSVVINEEMSKPFFYELDVFSTTVHNIDAKDIIGTKASIELVSDNNVMLYRNGFVSSLSRIGTEPIEGKTHYKLTIEPWLAWLEETNNCRIFQHKDVKGVISELFAPIPEADFDLAFVLNSYKKRDYWVQHNESTLDYFHRICRLEGLAYYFEHTQNGHRLKIIDKAIKLPPPPEPSVLNIQPGTEGNECLTSWAFTKHFVIGKSTQRSYFYETPRAKLESSIDTSGPAAKIPLANQLENYQYSEFFDNIPEANSETRVLNHHQTDSKHSIWTGSGDYRHLMVGQRFTVRKVPNDNNFADNDTPFNLTKLVLTINENSLEEDSDKQKDDKEKTNQDSKKYPHNHLVIEATSNDALIFPKSGTQKQILGLETAFVTGPTESEIFTDKYGRIKIQFHWDREGKHDENTTCWLRVMNNFSGPEFGVHYTPRVGQEVVVAFENGNPDRPFVLGGLYHYEHIPPFHHDLGLRAGTRTRSSKKGSLQQFNELSFYDKTDKEEIFVHAQKDHNSKVLHNRAERIDNHEIESVGGNRSAEVEGNQQEKIGGSLNLSVGGGPGASVLGMIAGVMAAGSGDAQKGAGGVGNALLSKFVGALATASALAETLSLSSNKAFNKAANHVKRGGKDQSATADSLGKLLSKIMPISGVFNTVVEKFKSDTIGIARTEQIGLYKNTTVGHTQTTNVGDTQVTNVGDTQENHIGTFKKTVVGEEYVIEVGKAKMTMKSDGTITFEGTTIKNLCDCEFKVNAKNNVTIKGKKILEN